MKLFRCFLVFIVVLIAIGCINKIQLRPIEHQEYNIIIHKKLYVDSDFDTREKIIIQKAVDEWKYATNGIISFDLVFNFNLDDTTNDDPNKYVNKAIIRKLTSEDLLTKNIDAVLSQELSKQAEEEVNVKIFGYTMKRQGFEYIFIVADRCKSDKQFFKTAIHEISHSINMEHDDSAPSVMNVEYEMTISAMIGKNLDPVSCLTKADMAQFCSLYLCDPTKLHGC